MYKALGMGLLVSLCAIGCVAAQPRVGWVPQTREEMQQLIGQTTMEALDQYQRLMLQKRNLMPKGKMLLPPKPL